MSIREEIAQGMKELVVTFDEPKADKPVWQVAWLLHRNEAFDEDGARVLLDAIRDDSAALGSLRTFLLTDGLDHTIVKQVKTLIRSLHDGKHLLEDGLHADDTWDLVFLAECLRDAIVECRRAMADKDVSLRLQLERELKNHDLLSEQLDAMVLALVGAHACDVLGQLRRMRDR